MSELLSKNNQNLSISTKNNNELKIKYKELKDEYDSLLNKSESDKKKYMNNLNKKNQQIKSLEHINTKLSNQINENKNEDKKNLNHKKPTQKYGKISKNKINKKNEINIETNLNSGKGLFNKDEKCEKNLEKFLNFQPEGELFRYPNIAAFQVNEQTRANIENVFLTMILRWSYLPSEAELVLYREHYRRFYSEGLCAIFQEAIDMNAYNFYLMQRK